MMEFNYDNVPLLITDPKFKNELTDYMVSVIKGDFHTPEDFEKVFDLCMHVGLCIIAINLCASKSQVINISKTLRNKMLVDLVNQHKEWLLDILDRIINLEEFTKEHFGKKLNVLRPDQVK